VESLTRPIRRSAFRAPGAIVFIVACSIIEPPEKRERNKRCES